MAKEKTMAYMVDPTMSAAGIQAQAAPINQPQAFSYDVPMQANMMGNGRPVFNQQSQGMAQTAFGTPAMRQASVGAAFQSNAFYAALNDAKEKGASTFEVGGKKFDVK
jgi:hypothetical protein